MPTPPDFSPNDAQPWTAKTVSMSVEILDRMERAVAKVRDRLLRATRALNEAGIPYAVAGGNAVASWVATVDEGAVCNTRDVDLLVRRDDLPAITNVLQQTVQNQEVATSSAAVSAGQCGMARPIVIEH